MQDVPHEDVPGGGVSALLGTSAALGELQASGGDSERDAKAELRLAEVQTLFAGELELLEAAIAEVVADGVRPATDAASHLVSAGGKRIRPLTVLLSSACFGPISAATRELALVAELVHSATLLHDDVVDEGTDRRGRLAARKLWGNAVSVLGGDLLLTHALDRTFTHAPSAMPDLLRTLRRLVDGEVFQLRGRTALEPSEDSYFRVLENKTASLFGWASRAGARAGGADEAHLEAIGRFGEHLGVAFQLVDDVLDYAGDPAATGKSLLTDLTEGKLTLPLVYALEADGELSRDLARTREGDARAAARLGESVVASGSCDRVRLRALEETRRAVAALETLPESQARQILAGVAAELTNRSA